MDLTKIAELIDLVSRSRIAELDVTLDGTRVRILKSAEAGAETATVSHPAARASDHGVAGILSAAGSAQIALPVVPAATDMVVHAPMHGVFHRASAPGAAPFIEVGATIVPGQKICIIEAMKTFIGIEAEVAGTVLAVLAENGSEIEAGQPLFRLGLSLDDHP